MSTEPLPHASPGASHDADLIIVGGGGSGLAAAARGAELGLRILLLERQPQLGGTTGIAVGSFTANRTSLQSEKQIEDTLESHIEDAGRFASAPIEARNVARLRNHFLSEAADTFEWLRELGLVFHGPSPEPPNRVPRMHNVVPNARAYVAVLHREALRHGAKVLCRAAVTRLLSQSDQDHAPARIVGVEADVDGQPRQFSARLGVVLAAGDYANSPDLIRRFKGADFGDIEGINPHACGDGHRLAESVGARLLNMEITYGPELRFVSQPARLPAWLRQLGNWNAARQLMGWALPLLPDALLRAYIKRLLVTWQHPEEALFADGAILVNSSGLRFCTETESPQREIAVARQPGKEAYLVLDEPLCDHYSRWPHFISTAPEIAYAYVNDYLRLRPDIAVQGSTLEELVTRRRLSRTFLENLQKTLAYCREGSLPPVARYHGKRWVLLGPVKSWFTTTEGGAAITRHLEVLDEQNHPIPGLYAIGQNGLGGQILWGHGLHIAWAITSGRLLAEHLAQQS